MKTIRLSAIATAMVLVLVSTAWTAEEFQIGADLSSLPQVEQGGGVFRHGGQTIDPLPYLHDRGLDLVRLRLWHTPSDATCGLAATIEMAERVRDAGLDLLLDLHYSDTWADPAHQSPPAAWAALAPAALRDSVRAYTRDVLNELAARDCSPAMVQLGNEITPGLLWNEGRVGGAYDTQDQWTKLTDLLNAAREGIDEALPAGQRPEVMIHIDRGGDNAGARWFFDRLTEQGFDFDVIGLSYYPWWHGTLDDLGANLDDLAVRYGKDLLVVETAYPWTLDWFDDTHNSVGLPGQLLPGYEATPGGQRAFFADLIEIVSAVPAGRGRGVCWWEPAWIAAPQYGSGWENLTWFDDQGESLPILDLLSTAAGVQSTSPRTGFRLVPNPFQNTARLHLATGLSESAQVEVFDVRGHRLARDTLDPGSAVWTWRPAHRAAGTYFFRVRSSAGAWRCRATLIP